MSVARPGHAAIGGREDNRNDRPDLGRNLFGVSADLTLSPAPQWALNAAASFVRSDYLGPIPLLGLSRRVRLDDPTSGAAVELTGSVSPLSGDPWADRGVLALLAGDAA